jgi:hypothetical protein
LSNQPEIQAHYEECREAGSSHRLAEMLALRQSPSLQTDTRWLSGHVNGSQFVGHERIGDHYRKVAESYGVSTEGAVYKSQLARFAGDPKAWVRSRGDCIKIAAERGMTLEGGVNYKPPDSANDVANPMDEPYRVSDDIVNHEYEVLCDFEPDAAAAPTSEVKEEIRKKLSPGDD